MSKIIINKANLVFEAKATLGEGPAWDWRKELLFWVDIEGKVLHAHNAANKQNKHWQFDEMLGAAVPSESGALLLALESGVAKFELENHQLTKHLALLNFKSEMRFNDAKVSPEGQLWIGSMHKEFKAKTGCLYRLSSDLKSKVLIHKTTISNGMAWSLDRSKFYYIDSPTYAVRQYDYKSDTGTLNNEKIAIKIPQNYGAPDGMCIDTEGMLWVAHWGGSCVRRWNPNNGTLLEQINVDAPHVTSCCFGGKDLKTLYITTARSGLNQEQLEAFPLSGSLFSFQSKTAGTRLHYFKDVE